MMNRGTLTSITTCLLAVAGCTASTSQEAVANGSACRPSLQPPVHSPAYAKTPWPTEHADVWRTHAAPTGLPAGVHNMRLRRTSATLPVEPMWGYVGTRGKLYVIGGSPYLLNMFTELMLGASNDQIPQLTARTLLASTQVTPYVAQIDATTMTVDKVLHLKRGVAINYTGGLLVHSNGFLYAVVRAVLYKIDPATFSIVASRRLPLPRTENNTPNLRATYNGMVATPRGELILKGWASSGGGENADGMLVRANPRTLKLQPSTLSGISSARMAIVEDGRRELIYMPGPTQSARFLVTPSAFPIDDPWSTTYLRPESGDTMASSDIYMGNGVLFANNTNPQATTPMRVFAQGAAPNSPLQKAKAFRGKKNGWNFFMIAGDPYRSGMAAVQDQATGRVAGYLACDGGVSFAKRWENGQITSSAGMAVNYNAGHLYTDDRSCTPSGRCRLYLVVLDLRNGRELARVRVMGTRPSMGQIFAGRDAVYYIAAQTGRRQGFITRITAGR